MSDLTDWATKQAATRPWENKMACGCEDGGHEPDCQEHQAHAAPYDRKIWLPRVLNKHWAKDIPANAVYVGRGSLWGNPFSWRTEPHTLRVADREQAVYAYSVYIEQRPELAARARVVLRGKDLLCFCLPALCHGSILLKIANED